MVSPCYMIFRICNLTHRAEVIEAHRRVPRIRKDSAPQYPSDSEEEGYLSRRQESHESYLPHSRSPASHDTFASQSRRLSRSAIPHRRRDSSSEEGVSTGPNFSILF